MPEANQSLQTSVQRLRRKGIATLLPGSQVSSPQVLRSECPPGLNMPHPTRPVVIGETLRFTAAVMGQRAAVKRWHTAQTAASPPPFRLSRLRGGTDRGSRASAHHSTTSTFSTAARAGAWQGQIPPIFHSGRAADMS